MRRHRLVVVAAAVAALLLFGLASLSRQHRGSPPIEVRVLGNVESTASGTVATNPAFWISNRTTKLLAVTPWAVQVKDVVDWTNLGYRGFTTFLPPGAVATQTLDFSTQLYPEPTNMWRLQINVAEKLSRAGSLVAALKHYRGWYLQGRRVAGTNFPYPPPGWRATWYGHPSKVLSETVGERPSQN